MVERAKVLVVGGGVIGRGCYEFLKYDHEVTVIDKRPDHPWKGQSHFVHKEDFLDDPGKHLGAYDYCINTAPVYDPDVICRLVGACVSKETHYLDFSEDVHVGDAIRREWAGASPDILIAPHCGLAPGLIQIIANSLTKPFDEVDSIRMYVGALPISADNEMKYHASWSADGVVNEYVNPALVIHGGEKKYVSSLDGLKSVIICEKKYEAFYTSGGCGTLPNTWEGRATTVEYRTVRYPGHYDYLQRRYWDLIVKSRINAGHVGFANHHQGSVDDFRELLEESKTVQDYTDTVVILVTVSGMYEGKLRCNQFSAEIEPFMYQNHKFQAIQRMTVGGMALILDSHYEGRINKTGLLKQEDVDWDTLQESRYFKLVF